MGLCSRIWLQSSGCELDGRANCRYLHDTYRLDRAGPATKTRIPKFTIPDSEQLSRKIFRENKSGN
jgi:hypothetical protein